MGGDVRKKTNLEREFVMKSYLDNGVLPTEDGNFIDISEEAAESIKADIDAGVSFSTNNTEGPEYGNS